MEQCLIQLESLYDKCLADLNFVEYKLVNGVVASDTTQPQAHFNPCKLIQRVRQLQIDLKTVQVEAARIKTETAMVVQTLSTQLESIVAPEILTLAKCANASADLDVLELERYTIAAKSITISSSSCTALAHDKLEVDKENTVTAPIITPTHSGKRQFAPVTKVQFESVSSMIKGKPKLEDVNFVFKALFDHFSSIKKGPIDPLTTSQMTENLGLKITGATGVAKLNVLRNLKLIQMSSKGVLLA